MYTLERIFELVKKKKIQQKDLATNIGVRPSALSDWKKQRIKPSVDDIIKIAQYFNVSTDYILGLTDSATPHAQQGEILSDTEHELLTGYRQLDESDQGEVRGYIKGMLNNDKYKTHNEEAIG